MLKHIAEFHHAWYEYVDHYLGGDANPAVRSFDEAQDEYCTNYLSNPNTEIHSAQDNLLYRTTYRSNASPSHRHESSGRGVIAQGQGKV